jgi:hypothetical protein
MPPDRVRPVYLLGRLRRPHDPAARGRDDGDDAGGARGRRSDDSGRRTYICELVPRRTGERYVSTPVNVDLPKDAEVVVCDDHCERYHRPPALPWRVAGCQTSFPNGAESMTRGEAEAAGYEPCRLPNCFGEDG